MSSPIPVPNEHQWQRPTTLRAVPHLENASFAWHDEETGEQLHVRVHGSTRFVQELAQLGFQDAERDLEN